MPNRTHPIETSLDDFDKAVTNRSKEKYILRLYITGTSSRSILAVSNLKKICKEYLEEYYELEVIDLFKHPDLARDHQIIAAPTLIKLFPLPFKRIIGDMSKTENILLALDLR